jgi:hypothetical protein
MADPKYIPDDKIAEGKAKILAAFGSREGQLAWMLIHQAMSGCPTDICFWPHTGRKPIYDVQVSPQLATIILYGGTARQLQAYLNDGIEFSDGTVAPLAAIWGAFPMMPEMVTPERLAAVDLSMGEQRAGPNGETVRQMLAEQYQCKTPADVERVLRRYLAS